MTKPIKYALIAICAIVFVIGAMIVYRLFFLFSTKRTREYITAAAENTSNPNKAYELINEQVQSILKSQDQTKCVLITAEVEQVEKEQALVQTAVNRCYSFGFLEMPVEIMEGEVIEG